MAQVWTPPEESATAVRPVPRLLVSVGVVLSDVPPLPNRPRAPDPQHDTAPLSRMAQVWTLPEESATAVRPVPRLLVSVGVVLLNVPPLPNWPSPARPQHDTLPLSRMAQVWYCPDESATAVRPVPRLLVSVGEFLFDVPPLPNWPKVPSPQHDTAPLSRMAQVW